MYSELELEKMAQSFLYKAFRIDLQIPVIRNNRLRSSLGRYVMDGRGKALRIELSGKLLNYGTKEAIIGVLKHECIHYALHQGGKEMKDGSPLFEETLKKYGAPSTHELKVGKYYQFQCNACHRIGESSIKRIKRHPEHYRSHCCRARITILGEKIYQS